ncbi:MAG: dipicolinate synthase subunit DpsA [Oscillospiraceae bacterium]
MRHELNFWVLGGDMRQGKLAQLLAEDGHRVHTYALEDGAVPAPGLTAEPGLSGVEQADCVVLPLPVSSGGRLLNAPLSRPLSSDYRGARPSIPGADALRRPGGPGHRRLGPERGLTIRDYFAREELAVANAVPTAEGAVQIAMEQLPITIHGARVLVVGFGRVGRALAQRLAALGAKVTVAARRYESLAWAQASGYGAEQTGQLAGWLCGYDLVVNTVPTLVLGEAELADLKPDCLVLDLASKPGGVDLEAAGRLGRTVIWALSLPGKVAPVTAGSAIKNTIYHMLHELGA